MTIVTDEVMMQRIATAKPFTVVIIKAGPRVDEAGSDAIIWEHGRRNFVLREEGLLSIACPISDGSEVKGVGIFNADVEKVKVIMDADPAVAAGIFIYEIHSTHSFPGDSLPE